MEADLEAFGNEIEQARLRQANAETAFRSITGREPGRLFAEPRGLENLPADLQQAKAKALESNPQVSQAYHRSAARRQAARAIFGEFLPRLDLAGSYRQDWDADDRRFADNDGWWVGLRVTVPLIEPEAVPAVLRSRADARRADFQSRDTRRRVARAVEETWNSRESAAERMATARRRIKALKEAEAGIRSQYIAGLRPLDDLLEVQVRTAQAELVELQAEQEHQLQGYRLLSLLGENVEVAGQQR